MRCIHAKEGGDAGGGRLLPAARQKRTHGQGRGRMEQAANEAARAFERVGVATVREWGALFIQTRERANVEVQGDGGGGAGAAAARGRSFPPSC